MLLNRAYYLVKPIMPWRLRVALRQRLADRRRRAHADVWPIDPKSAAIPPGWPGWPDGKRFAFVLTHDVEGPKGLARVERLMNLELKYGFRSSFNFVPEGGYKVSDALRETVEKSGCEVGVHGLEHDGKLYRSKSEFAAKARKIKGYLRRWNASGFRSPLMQHKLGWLHLLGAEYDSSTFDTDPFEPEPDAAGTIFPFWVAGPQGGGYVELPYTLIQDFNCFKVLRESSIDIWKQKLDWVAKHGGMALLNTHPDYMCFEGNQERDEYSVGLYEEFLRYAREKYEGSFWPALPREVAQYYKNQVPLASRNTRKKICMVAYTPYEFDNRVRRYAETLAKRGDQVDVIAIGIDRSRPPLEEINGVTLHRIQHRDYGERRMWTYAWRLMRFQLKSALYLKRLHQRNRYDLIHIHNMPDFLVYAAWYPKWSGTKIILDIHDLVPELFANKFDTKSSGIYARVLVKMESASMAFADHVIVSNHLWRETLIARGATAEKCSVFVNHVDPEIFYRRERTRADDKFVIIFPGSFQWHQGLDIAIEALALIRAEVPNVELHLYSGAGGNQEPALAALAKQHGVETRVKFCGALALHQMPDVIANADLGIVPKRADSFGNEAYSTKIMEFMSQGIPVVVSRTKIDAFYFEEGTVHFFTSSDARAMADAILDVIRNKDLRQGLIARGFEYVERNGWHRKKQEYLELVDTLSTENFSNVHSVSNPKPQNAVEPLASPVPIEREK